LDNIIQHTINLIDLKSISLLLQMISKYNLLQLDIRI
jgi:hypothetical protein